MHRRLCDAASAPELTGPVVHQALASGFGWVMLYGGVGVWIMAAVSFLIFNARQVAQVAQLGMTERLKTFFAPRTPAGGLRKPPYEALGYDV